MAIKIRRRKSLQTLKKDETFEVVSLNDPALDLEACDIEGYHRTLDPECLKLKTGAEQPTIFTLRMLSAAERDECFIIGGAARDRHSGGWNADSRARGMAAFEMALVKVDDEEVKHSDLELEPHLRAELGGYAYNVADGQVGHSEARDLGKYFCQDSCRVRASEPSSSAPPSAPSTA